MDGPSEDSKKEEAALASGEQAIPAGVDARDATQPEKKADAIDAPQAKKDDVAGVLPIDSSADVMGQHAAQDVAGEQPRGDSQDAPKGADAVAEVRPTELFNAAPVDAQGKGSANAAEAAALPADEKAVASPDAGRDQADAIKQDEAGKSDAPADALAAADAPHALADGGKADGQASPSKIDSAHDTAAQPAAAHDEESKASENALAADSKEPESSERPARDADDANASMVDGVQPAPTAVNEDGSAKAQPVAAHSPAAQSPEKQDAMHKEPPTGNDADTLAAQPPPASTPQKKKGSAD